jgi:AAA domain
MLNAREPADFEAETLLAEEAQQKAINGSGRVNANLSSPSETATVVPWRTSKYGGMSEESAWASWEASRQTRPNSIIQSSAGFVSGFIPPDYLIDGLLQRRFLYSLTGRTGGGKTAISLLVSASVALGRPIGSYTVQPGRVLYLAGENPDDIRMRWIAMAQQMDFDIKTIDVHFIPGTFKISEMQDRISCEVETFGGVALVVVDTSAAFFEGEDENSNVQLGTHARNLRGLVNLPGGPCVIANCHPVKNAGEDNLSPRGGGAFIAEVDGNLTAHNDGSIVQLHWQGKFRGPDFAPITFQLRSVTHERLKDSRGRQIPTVVAGHLSATEQEQLSTAARCEEDRLLEVLNDNPGASYSDLARTLVWTMKNGEPHKVKVERMLKKLEKQKLVGRDRDSWTVTKKGKKANAE